MARPPISDAVVDTVKEIWANDPRQNATQVHTVVKRRLGPGAVSLRKVQQVVAELKKRGAGRFQLSEWGPWQDPDATPEDADYLFWIQRMMIRDWKRRLYEHEAKWARRLRVVLRDADPEIQLLLIGLYAERERFAVNVQELPTYTEDLDGFVTFKPWLRKRWKEYQSAVEAGVVPPPYYWMDWVLDRPSGKGLSLEVSYVPALNSLFMVVKGRPELIPELLEAWGDKMWLRVGRNRELLGIVQDLPWAVAEDRLFREHLANRVKADLDGQEIGIRRRSGSRASATREPRK